jgi:colicin import membrane protein
LIAEEIRLKKMALDKEAH